MNSTPHTWYRLPRCCISDIPPRWRLSPTSYSVYEELLSKCLPRNRCYRRYIWFIRTQGIPTSKQRRINSRDITKVFKDDQGYVRKYFQ